MTRDQAIRKVAKLRALTVDRGATPAEAKLARERAGELANRFALTDFELGAPARKPPPAPQPTPQPEPGGVGIFVPSAGDVWCATTAGSSNNSFNTGPIWIQF